MFKIIKNVFKLIAMILVIVLYGYGAINYEKVTTPTYKCDTVRVVNNVHADSVYTKELIDIDDGIIQCVYVDTTENG